MIAYSDFIAAYPVFSNTSTYPEATANYWLGQGYAQLDQRTFGPQLDRAVLLYTAHNVALAALAAQTPAAVVAGLASGPASSTTIGSVSKSYDIGAVTIAGAGPWNMTIYGQQFYMMVQAFATGGVYVPSPRALFGSAPLRRW